jgi:hypothetical protein
MRSELKLKTPPLLFESPQNERHTEQSLCIYNDIFYCPDVIRSHAPAGVLKKPRKIVGFLTVSVTSVNREAQKNKGKKFFKPRIFLSYAPGRWLR